MEAGNLGDPAESGSIAEQTTTNHNLNSIPTSKILSQDQRNPMESSFSFSSFSQNGVDVLWQPVELAIVLRRLGLLSGLQGYRHINSVPFESLYDSNILGPL